MEDLITIDTITDWLLKQVQTKQPIHASLWLDAAQKIIMLLQNEQEKLFEMEQKVATIRNTIITQGKSVAQAKSAVEGCDEYREARKQKAKIDRALELIRVAKLQSRMASEIMRGQ